MGEGANVDGSCGRGEGECRDGELAPELDPDTDELSVALGSDCLRRWLPLANGGLGGGR